MNHNKLYYFSLQIRRIAVLLFTCVSSLSKFGATHFFSCVNLVLTLKNKFLNIYFPRICGV